MTISFKLDEKSINSAIKELEEYKKSINDKGNTLVKNLTTKGEDTAKSELRDMVDGGWEHLISSIKGTFNPEEGVGTIRAYADYAIFAEFGTGVIGKGVSTYKNQNKAGVPHPLHGEFWTYDYNEHGEKGWRYKADDGSIRWTKGQVSKPFMYNTIQFLRDRLGEEAREVFK